MREVLVYNGEGVGPQSFRQAFEGLKRELPSFFVREVDARALLNEQWEERASLVAIPGGADIPYMRALNGEGNRRIRQFVEEGGLYLGICAGGYYGSSAIEFEKGNRLEVCGKRELSFFPGMAVGPAYGPNLFRYTSEAGARLAQVSWTHSPVILIRSILMEGAALFRRNITLKWRCWPTTMI